MAMTVMIVLLLLTLPASHVVGALAARRLRVGPGMARDVMPALPASPPVKGRAERRWERQLDKVEARLLSHMAQGAQGVDAAGLSAQLGLEVEVVEAALARMREEIPCRLQITRQGRMLHDFAAQDIAALVSRRRRAGPMRALLFVLAAFANIGAAWPFLSMTFISIGGLLGMSAAPEGEALIVGVTALIGAGLLFVVTFISGFVMHLLLTPLISGPRLGDVKRGEARPQRTTGHAADSGLYWLWLADSASHSSSSAFYAGSSSSSWGSSSSSGGGGGGFDLDFDGDDASGVLVVIVVVLLLAVVAASLSAIFFWLRGVWRAIKRLDEPQRGTSVTMWVRTADAIDKIERYIPTNDLVVRALHALRRAFSTRRPQDDDMAARVLILAKRYGGKVSALQIALYSGLDDQEAAEVGARLTNLVGGQILISDAGELVFAFPPKVLEALVSQPDEDMWAEYLSFDASGRARRREHQVANAVPVNVVGLTKGHLAATDRLVAGTYVMALMGIGLLAPMVGLLTLPLVAYVPLALMLVMMAFGAASLSAVSRYSSKVLAGQGVRRDVRRAAFLRVRRALEQGRSVVDLTGLDQELLAMFKPAWSGLKLDVVSREVRAVCVDLDLEPLMDGSAKPGQDVYDIRPLRARLGALDGLEDVFGDGQSAVVLGLNDGADDVIFDSMIEHEEEAVERRHAASRS